MSITTLIIILTVCVISFITIFIRIVYLLKKEAEYYNKLDRYLHKINKEY